MNLFNGAHSRDQERDGTGTPGLDRGPGQRHISCSFFMYQDQTRPHQVHRGESVYPLLRRLVMLLMFIALPTVLTGCPDDDTSIDEAVEEVGDELDDAIDN